ncbi:hypothetical protein [Pseudomonas sp. H9]|nr:hypothetical protein [Pseudomonas sp. H9]
MLLQPRNRSPIKPASATSIPGTSSHHLTHAGIDGDPRNLT